MTVAPEIAQMAFDANSAWLLTQQSKNGNTPERAQQKFWRNANDSY
jgi:hypothetical protein